MLLNLKPGSIELLMKASKTSADDVPKTKQKRTEKDKIYCCGPPGTRAKAKVRSIGLLSSLNTSDAALARTWLGWASKLWVEP